jgi:DNA-binding NtrC family response regulator
MLVMRVLIVDGSKGLQSFMRQLFEDFSFDMQYIKTADDPHTALKIAQTLKPQFLLTDWFAQESITGIALHQQMVLINPKCQFALLSAEVGAEQTKAARDAGALFLLTTPCTAEQMRMELGNALRSLVKKVPSVDAHVHANTSTAQRHLATLKMAATLPVFRTSDRVTYKGRADSITEVIFRQGEMMVRLAGVPGLISAKEVQK